MEESFIIQTIVTNFFDTSKIIHYRNRLYDSYTYGHLLNAMQIFEVDQSNYNISNEKNTLLNNEDQSIENIIKRIDRLALTINENNNKKDFYLKRNIFCTKCNSKGHTKYDCRNNNLKHNFSTQKNFTQQNDNKNTMFDKIKEIELIL
ncbi:hypothetical protein COBT_004198, partial [Conglomerata obtusa]